MPDNLKKTIALKNPIDPSTWLASETLTNASYLRNSDGSVTVLPVVMVNPSKSPITASGVLGNVQATITDSTYLNNATVVAGLVHAQGNALQTYSINAYDNSVGYDAQKDATNISSVTATAGSTQLVAAGGAGKKYRIWGMALSLSGAPNVACNATINEVTSGVVLMQVHIAAEGAGVAEASVSKAISIPGNGVLQTTANNAIQLTAAGAGCPADAELIYSAAE